MLCSFHLFLDAMTHLNYKLVSSPSIIYDYQPEERSEFFWNQGERICHREEPGTRILINREVRSDIIEDFILTKATFGWERYVAVYYQHEPSPYTYHKDLMYDY